jgi:molybdopterin synthase sulfur carrier subunit
MKPTIEIKLYATLLPYAPANASCYPIESGTSIEKLIEELTIPKDQVKLVFSNGVKCGLGTLIQDGDRIGVFPPVGGG